MVYMIFQHVQNNSRQSLSPVLGCYLKMCGMSDRKISRLNAETLLFHDLEIYGEIAEDYINILHENFSVNIDEFCFEKYFPCEFSNDGLMQMLLQWFFPWFATSSKEKNRRHPLPLSKIEQAIVSGKLI